MADGGDFEPRKIVVVVFMVMLAMLVIAFVSSIDPQPAAPMASLVLVYQSNANPCPTGGNTLVCSVGGLTVGGQYFFVATGFTYPYSSVSFSCVDSQGFAVAVTSAGNQKAICSVEIAGSLSATDSLTMTAGSGAFWQGSSEQLFRVVYN